MSPRLGKVVSRSFAQPNTLSQLATTLVEETEVYLDEPPGSADQEMKGHNKGSLKTTTRSLTLAMLANPQNCISSKRMNFPHSS
jgi:hypothetical protein